MKKKGKQLNSVAYAECTKVEQFWHAKMKGGINVDDQFQDMHDEAEQFEEEENMQEAIKQSLLSMNLQLYLAFLQKLLATT